MNKNEQIEEMARVIARRSKSFRDPNIAFMTTAERTATSLYAKGYRKVERGEWIEDSLVDDTVICSLCGCTDNRYDYDLDRWGSKFCPECGADMRGEENG